MPDGPSDFVSYQELLGLNADEVARAKQRAQEEYDASMGDANNALARAGTEARTAARQGAGGGLTQTGSYSDYLKARTQAQTAYTRLRGGGGGRGMDAALASGAADGSAQDPGLTLDAQEGRLDSWAGEAGQQGRNERASAAEWQRRDAADKQAEADKREAWRQQMMTLERQKLQGAAQRMKDTNWYNWYSAPQWSADGMGLQQGPYGRNTSTGMTPEELAATKRRYAQYGGTDANQLYNYDQAGHWEMGKWVTGKPQDNAAGNWRTLMNAQAGQASDALLLAKRKAGG